MSNSKFDFQYLADKILAEDFTEKPFKHIEINNFFSEEHFESIINSNELRCPDATTDEELINELEKKGFKNIKFPGAITSKQDYIDWRDDKNHKVTHHSACEGFGYVMRLYDERTEILKAIKVFMESDTFLDAICEKFSINRAATKYDGGIQKYLDGYEISPHPDTRRKAATFMVNINPSHKSHQMDHHTHYMQFTQERAYIQTLWMGNQNIDRTWVPWNWATTVKQQIENNSIVLFSPADDTLHGVKTNYDHLISQRTQLYGNLWYETANTDIDLDWEELDFVKNTRRQTLRNDEGEGHRNI